MATIGNSSEESCQRTRWKEIGALFDGALERTEEKRRGWLAEVCGDGENATGPAPAPGCIKSYTPPEAGHERGLHDGRRA